MAGRSKLGARRRVREANARASEAQMRRKRVNIGDAVAPTVVADRIRQIDAWEAQRLAEIREQVCAEAARRRADCCTDANAAIARMRDRGEALAAIAALAGVGVGEVRALLRRTRQTEIRAAVDISGGTDDYPTPGMELPQ